MAKTSWACVCSSAGKVIMFDMYSKSFFQKLFQKLEIQMLQKQIFFSWYCKPFVWQCVIQYMIIKTHQLKQCVIYAYVTLKNPCYRTGDIKYMLVSHGQYKF